MSPCVIISLICLRIALTFGSRGSRCLTDWACHMKYLGASQARLCQGRYSSTKSVSVAFQRQCRNLLQYRIMSNAHVQVCSVYATQFIGKSETYWRARKACESIFQSLESIAAKRGPYLHASTPDKLEEAAWSVQHDWTMGSCREASDQNNSPSQAPLLVSGCHEQTTNR